MVRGQPGSAIAINNLTWTIPSTNVFPPSLLMGATQSASEELGGVWIDVACIDQENFNTKLEKIGNQAGTFARARKAFICPPPVLDNGIDYQD